MRAEHRRHDISDQVWELLKPHLPGGAGKRGRPAKDNRLFLNIEVDGHEDRHWDDVLQVLNGSTIPAVRFLRRRETHQCRLVSYNRRRLPYLWSVRMLGYIDGTGWTFLEPGA